MKVVMLAAGIGARLGITATKHPPKILLRFGGKSLLQMHIEIFKQHGIEPAPDRKRQTTWATFLFEAANFLVLAAALGWLFFRPVRAAIERRRSEIEGERRAAVAARAEAENALSQARARRSELESSIEQLREGAQREAENERKRLIEAARTQTQHEREALKQELLSLRRTQARSLAQDASLAAKTILVRLLERMNGPDLEDTLLKTACLELEKLRLSGPLAPIVVESARKLDDKSLAAVVEAAGVSLSDARHRVDAELVTGLRVLTGRGLVDASAQGLAAQAERIIESRLEHENAVDG